MAVPEPIAVPGCIQFMFVGKVFELREFRDHSKEPESGIYLQDLLVR